MADTNDRYPWQIPVTVTDTINLVSVARYLSLVSITSVPATGVCRRGGVCRQVSITSICHRGGIFRQVSAISICHGYLAPVSVAEAVSSVLIIRVFVTGICRGYLLLISVTNISHKYLSLVTVKGICHPVSVTGICFRYLLLSAVSATSIYRWYRPLVLVTSIF